ncbi:protein eva-1 homolog C isoform X3 [Pipistrellus kuhlii]|uniref:Protein eva-1 homolog C n=1 Tax=Pipistrellus kuhlii TaxID=59472 RepID=A0A7J7R4A4_PIPKU|nr:protein eva-1 homolog C isoform X3 [Pipistrellus kuhlii]KAF6270990.1 eva-1-like protein C [Pipistrellus kuhlii]
MLPPRPAPPPAPPPGARRQGEPPGRLLRLLCAVLVCSGEIAALADFSGYLTKLLQNHTAYACDGDQLSLQCPRHSSISIQAAFYGQDGRACGGQRPAPGGDGPACEAPTTFQKVLDECQSQRACRLLVNSRVFGPDLCPGSSKYLLVSFKCQPNELKNQTVCEGQELTLHCHPSKSLRIYAAAFGRRARDADLCASAARPPPFDCLSHSAAHLLARRCYGRPRCRVLVDSLHFGSPCPPGARKYLTVAYACVPRTILSALDPALAEPAPSPKQEDADGDRGAGPEDPRESGVRRKEGVMVSSSLAAFAYIRAHPDRAALLFVSSVGVGLALTLCALVARVSCARDLQALRGARERLVAAGDGASEDSEDADGSEASSGSSLPGEPPGLRRTAHPAYTALEAAELAERIERREQIIQEIWMNSGLDTSVPRSTGPFY